MRYTSIILPTRPQPDTIVAIFLLKRFGENKFLGISDADIDVWQILPDDTRDENFDEKGVILIDIGGGRFDHHNKNPKTTASELVADYLDVKEDPALSKLLQYTRRDDFFGKGILSNDPLDRAFGLSGLVANLNKKYVEDPAKVVQTVLPLLEAHFDEEVRRTKELPEELEKKIKDGKAEFLTVKQRDRNLKCIFIESNNASMAGFLRSQQGGRFDVVAQQANTGHINILTRPTKRVDLTILAGLIREAELMKKGINKDSSAELLTMQGKIEAVPEWYFDLATNSIQNGGLNPTAVPPTALNKKEIINLLNLGLNS